MKTRNWIVASLFGAVLGAGLVIACSDDSPGDADAATCDCPAAEPPLTGRIVAVTGQGGITANSSGGGAAVCPSGATVLGGGCKLMTQDGRIVLFEAKFNRDVPNTPGYECNWISTSPTNNVGIAEAICLVPAP